jgi:hypothetical protein
MRKISFSNEEDYTDCQDLAFHDIPELKGNYLITRQYLEARFPKIQTVLIGTRIAYFKSSERPVHYGLGTKRGTIISKMGIGGGVFEHRIEENFYDLKNFSLYFIPPREDFDMFLLSLL